MNSKDTDKWKGGVVKFILLLITSSICLGLVLRVSFSGMSPSDYDRLRFPYSLEIAQELGEALSSFTETHFYNVVVAHAACYVYLQAFAIPGTIFFNILAGALFGLWRGFFLCVIYNATGSVCHYAWSKVLGEHIIECFFKEKMEMLKSKLDTHRQDLTMYMICIRIFPFSPNWFINLSAPHLGVSLWQFIPGVMFGLIPYNFLSCKAGLILQGLRSKADIFDTATTVQLLALSVFGVLLRRLYRDRFADEKGVKTE